MEPISASTREKNPHAHRSCEIKSHYETKILSSFNRRNMTKFGLYLFLFFFFNWWKYGF